jgi:hypothetical protein
MLLKVTEVTSPSVVDSGIVFAIDNPLARFVPKMETSEPGATPCVE